MVAVIFHPGINVSPGMEMGCGSVGRGMDSCLRRNDGGVDGNDGGVGGG